MEKKVKMETLRKRMSANYDKLENYTKEQIKKEGESNTDEFNENISKLIEEQEDRIEDKRLQRLREYVEKLEKEKGK